MKELICITCPKGCIMKVNEDGTVISGDGCSRGVEYAKKEMTNPTRVITSTVCIEGAGIDRLPVKTDRDIPKGDIFAAMRLLDALTVTAPVKVGDIIVPNILGSQANFVATRSLPKCKAERRDNMQTLLQR